MRIGLGYDAHAFVDGRDLFLGGLRIPHNKGLLGHSDGDVLLHAISDALLGAAGAEDIGAHFPNTDESIKGIESATILAHVGQLVRDKGFSIINIDAIVVCEAPRIQPYREKLKNSIAGILGVDTDRISVKGKTTEGMGFAGRREGIEARAVCLID
jgi:2-C-methyl-D-erythritol 2,4-cyclodiphosphate synthase